MRRDAFDAEAALYRSLANPVRLRILDCLSKTERTAGEIGVVLGLAQSPTSQHLARLRAAHLVTTRRHAQAICYSLAPEACNALETLRAATASLRTLLPPAAGRPGKT